MTFWDEALTAVGSFFGNNSGGLIQAGVALGGAALNAYQNEEAADAITEAARLEAGAIAGANADAARRFDEIRAVSGPALDVLRAQMNQNPEELTPSQALALEDSRRITEGTLAASGLRGAGRATQALVTDADNRFRARAFEANRARSDIAARTLAAQGLSASTNQAGLISETGRAAGSAFETAGVADAARGLATGASISDAMGAIGSVIADDVKRRGRARRNKAGEDKKGV